MFNAERLGTSAGRVLGWWGVAPTSVLLRNTIKGVACAQTFVPFRSTITLVPRPHPLTRRNGLVNQGEFLGLAGTLATV